MAYPFSDGNILTGADLNNALERSPMHNWTDRISRVLSGCKVTTSGTGDFDITSGKYVDSNGQGKEFSSSTGHTISAPTNNRVDAITLADDGTITVTTGTEASNTSDVQVPDYPTSEILLGYIQLVNGDGIVKEGDIQDMRMRYGSKMDLIAYRTLNNNEGRYCPIRVDRLPNEYNIFKIYIMGNSTGGGAEDSTNISITVNTPTEDIHDWWRVSWDEDTDSVVKSTNINTSAISCCDREHTIGAEITLYNQGDPTDSDDRVVLVDFQTIGPQDSYGNRDLKTGGKANISNDTFHNFLVHFKNNTSLDKKPAKMFIYGLRG